MAHLELRRLLHRGFGVIFEMAAPENDRPTDRRVNPNGAHSGHWQLAQRRPKRRENERPLFAYSADIPQRW